MNTTTDVAAAINEFKRRKDLGERLALLFFHNMDTWSGQINYKIYKIVNKKNIKILDLLNTANITR